MAIRLNAPTGAWCSLTCVMVTVSAASHVSQCTYRCVVLPDTVLGPLARQRRRVSMHLQVRGAP